MINGENSNNYEEYTSDLNELFQRTFEFDILTYVTRGLIKNQQNYENEIIELKLECLNNQKQISLLYEEINKIKGNNNQKNSEENENIIFPQNKENIEENIQKLLNEKKRINMNNKIIEINNNKDYYEEDINNEYKNIQINVNEEINKQNSDNNNNKYIINEKENKEKKIDKNEKNEINIMDNIIKKENISSEKAPETQQYKQLDDLASIPQIQEKVNEDKNSQKDIQNNKINDNKLNQLKQTDFINPSIIHKEKDILFRPKSIFNQINPKYRINTSQIDNELKNLNTKLSDIEKDLNQFKKFAIDTISETKNNIPDIISNQLLSLKEEFQTNINLLKDNVNQKINPLNDIIKKLTDMNEENERLMNITKSQNTTLSGKMDIINAKFMDQVSKTEFDKYKNVIYDKLENDNKGINIDLSLVKKSISGLKTQILEFTSDQTDHENLEKLIQKQESTNIIINKLQEFHKEFLEKEKKKLNLDPTKLVDLDQFGEFKKTQNKINEKNKKDISDANRDINDILNFELVNKASIKDLKNLEDKILSKMEELLNTIREKFVEKKSLQKFTKLVEYQTKVTLEEFKTNLKPGINWLMSKKPMGHLCASCEAYLGDLNPNTSDKFIPWNKYSSKEMPENKINKVSGGFSKIIQMTNNYDNDKDISQIFLKKNLKQNIDNNVPKNMKKNEQYDENNKKTATNSANYSNIYGNVSKTNVNSNSNNISKININIENNNSFQIEEYETDIINSLPKIKKKTLSASNIQNFDENLLQKHSFSIVKGKRDNDNNDFIIMTKQDNDKKKNKNDLGSPKITKILKKINKNKDTYITLLYYKLYLHF